LTRSSSGPPQDPKEIMKGKRLFKGDPPRGVVVKRGGKRGHATSRKKSRKDNPQGPKGGKKRTGVVQIRGEEGQAKDQRGG